MAMMLIGFLAGLLVCTIAAFIILYRSVRGLAIGAADALFTSFFEALSDLEIRPGTAKEVGGEVRSTVLAESEVAAERRRNSRATAKQAKRSAKPAKRRLEKLLELECDEPDRAP